jgi:hypothetical protein
MKEGPFFGLKTDPTLAKIISIIIMLFMEKTLVPILKMSNSTLLATMIYTITIIQDF